MYIVSITIEDGVEWIILMPNWQPFAAVGPLCVDFSCGVAISVIKVQRADQFVAFAVAVTYSFPLSGGKSCRPGSNIRIVVLMAIPIKVVTGGI